MICILNVITYTFSNETTEYIPKRKQSKVQLWMKRKVDQISKSICSILTMYGNKHELEQYVKILTYSVMAMEAKANMKTNSVRFDTDSVPVGIDNWCTGCISHVAEDFVGQLRDSDKSIKGFGGSRTSQIKIGTLSWKWMDNEGKESKFLIPNSYYVPSGGVRLLSPQHWARTREGLGKNGYHGTICQTTSRDIMLMWNDRKNKLTVPLSKESNVGTFHLAPGYSRYEAFCCTLTAEDKEWENNAILSMNTSLTTKEINIPNKGLWNSTEKNLDFKDSNLITLMEWDLDEEKVKEYNEVYSDNPIKWNNKSKETNDTPNQLLKIHQRFGHISFAKLQIMAKKGIIPSKYASCDIPICQACAYAKMIKRPWRNKPEKEYVSPKAKLKPGDVVSVDQLVSPVPGFVAQMTGKLTTKRYRYATIFVDQSSKVGYTHLQKTADAEETVEAKIAFESFMQSMGVSVRAYHADNGIFRANKWVESCTKSNQRLTFAGVNAHHQNGVAERRIRELQELVRRMMIHANRKWPHSLSTTLWPYALRMANNIYNHSPFKQHIDHLTPIQVATGTKVEINQKHFKPFGCPVYVLNWLLQLGHPHGKWKERSKVGVYLGPSPMHNRNVALVLDLDTGLVSPQFHVLYDTEFRTVADDTTIPAWKVKAGFLSERELEISKQNKDKTPVIIPGLDSNLRAIEAKRKEMSTPEGDDNNPTTIKRQKISGTNTIHLKDDPPKKKKV